MNNLSGDIKEEFAKGPRPINNKKKTLEHLLCPDSQE
jgi:hypothetical protein